MVLNPPPFDPTIYTILVIDDTIANLSVMVDYLNSVGFRVLTARNGDSGVKRAIYGHPDMILLDVIMPGIDGFETCRQLKEHEETRHIPVIFMTALSDTVHKVRGFEAGAVDYVTKPVQQSEVLARVTTHLQIRTLTHTLEQTVIALEQEQARLEQIVSSLPGSVIIINQSPPYLILWANQEAEHYLGNSLSKLLNTPFPYTFLDETAEEMLRTTLNNTGRVKEFIGRMRLANSDIFWGRITMTPMMYNDEMALLVIVENINDIKKAEETLLAAKKRETLDELAAGVAHELRNPLGAITNAVYYLQSTLPNQDETTLEYFEIINTLVARSENIVSDLLSLSTKRATRKEGVAIGMLIDKVLALCPPPEGITLARTNAKGDCPMIWVDADQIEQAFVNLIRNSYQAMPSGGALYVSTICTAERVEVTIRDTGEGIPQENIEQIFEPLFTTKAQGIGLGLAIAQSLIDMNEGTIGVTSEAGQGANFAITLPVMVS